MSDTPSANTTTTNDNTKTPALKRRKSPGTIKQASLAEIKLSAVVSAAALDATHAPILATEELNSETPTRLAALVESTRNLAGEVVASRKAISTIGKAEANSKQVLITKLRDIQQRAKRKFGDDAAQRARYCINKDNFARARQSLEQDAVNLLAFSAADHLPGLTAERLAAANAAYTAWCNSDTAQSKAVELQGKLSAQFEAAIKSMQTLRQEIQGAADTAWPYDVTGSAHFRRAFRLPTRKPWSS